MAELRISPQKITRELLTHRLDCSFYHPDAIQLDYKLKEYGHLKKLVEIIDPERTITNGVRGPELKTSNYYLVRLQDCKDWEIDFDGCVTISEKQFKENKRCQLQEGDVVVAIGGYVGNASIARHIQPAVIGQHSAVLPNNSRFVDGRYLVAYLNSKWGAIQFQRYVSGTVQPGVNLEDLREIPIPIPDPKIQTYIGDKVRQLERLRDRSRELEQEIQDDFSFLTKDLKSRKKAWRISGNKVEAYRLNATHYDAVALDMLERAQDTVKLISLESLFGSRGMSGGATPKGAIYPELGVFFVRVQNVKPLRLDLSDAVYLSASQNRELERSWCKAQEIILTITGYPGTAAIVLEDDLPLNINQHSVRFDITEEWEPEYIVAALNSMFMKLQVNRLAIGATRDALDYTSVSSLLIPVLPVEVRQRITNSVKAANIYIRSSERLTTTAKLLVEALIEGKLSEADLKAAQEGLECGDTTLDREILARLTRKGIDTPKEPPLFPDLDALYTALASLDETTEAVAPSTSQTAKVYDFPKPYLALASEDRATYQVPAEVPE